MIDLAQLRICVTGGGDLDRYVCHKLRRRGVRKDRLIIPRSSDYDLTDPQQCRNLFEQCRPDVVIHLATQMGGIEANRIHPVRFFYANMAIGLYLIEQARLHRIVRFVHTGTVCAYPKMIPVPFSEGELCNGYPKPTNEPYCIAKKPFL